MFCWFTALTLIPLADFTAISFTAPMFLTLLAMLLLGERIHAYRWTALAIGFVGVLIMIGPHLTLGGSSLGVARRVRRGRVLGARDRDAAQHERQRRRAPARDHVLLLADDGRLLGAHGRSRAGRCRRREQWVFIVLAGLFGVFGPAADDDVVPLRRGVDDGAARLRELVDGGALGYYFFGEVPHWSMWVGAPLVIAAGSIILWREYRRYAAVPAPVVPND